MIRNWFKIQKLEKMHVIQRNENGDWIVTKEFKELIMTTAWRYEDDIDQMMKNESYEEVIITTLGRAIRTQAALKKERIWTFREWCLMVDIMVIWYPVEKFKTAMGVD